MCPRFSGCHRSERTDILPPTSDWKWSRVLLLAAILRLLFAVHATASDVCSTPTNPVHGKFSLPLQGVFQAGTFLTLTCDTGYVLQGEALVLCNATGHPTPPGKCLGTCPIPTDPENGAFSKPLSGTFLEGADLTLSCDNGFKVAGPNKTTCQANGEATVAGACCGSAPASSVSYSTFLIITVLSTAGGLSVSVILYVGTTIIKRRRRRKANNSVGPREVNNSSRPSLLSDGGFPLNAYAHVMSSPSLMSQATGFSAFMEDPPPASHLRVPSLTSLNKERPTSISRTTSLQKLSAKASEGSDNGSCHRGGYADLLQPNEDKKRASTPSTTYSLAIKPLSPPTDISRVRSQWEVPAQLLASPASSKENAAIHNRVDSVNRALLTEWANPGQRPGANDGDGRRPSMTYGNSESPPSSRRSSSIYGNPTYGFVPKMKKCGTRWSASEGRDSLTEEGDTEDGKQGTRLLPWRGGPPLSVRSSSLRGLPGAIKTVGEERAQELGEKPPLPKTKRDRSPRNISEGNIPPWRDRPAVTVRSSSPRRTQSVCSTSPHSPSCRIGIESAGSPLTRSVSRDTGLAANSQWLYDRAETRLPRLEHPSVTVRSSSLRKKTPLGRTNKVDNSPVDPGTPPEITTRSSSLRHKTQHSNLVHGCTLSASYKPGTGALSPNRSMDSISFL